ncbi:16S rRNA (cytosine(967)-C(5))-methyltransferase RsmB [Candidatus Parabeggiatoa sp. HSG14]|uniref:16S rRNA (cytosine(967)-C(5))-methyltransferase RsmB n=1 Tax=Candidatus Parabeggiatoa sp. HSG14 TaxID=3055593 RepID=UPI0025A8A95E|nr:16S rRNA (cytosine(967)-C(5))-methyltransferase RsmB [Thiotrichales bacterium HSG14]
MDARSVATQILTQVIWHKHSLSDCLDTYLPDLNDARERALAQNLCYGVLRWLRRLQALLQCLLKQPLKDKDSDIQALLLIGLYQLIYLRIPPYATAATVNVTRTLKKTWATGLVNGVLRNFQRKSDILLAKVDTDISVKLAHPIWLLKRLKKDWPTQWEAVAQANNSHPPLTLRVNNRCLSRDAYLEHLREVGIAATPTPYVDSGITLDVPMDVQNLPGFTPVKSAEVSDLKINQASQGGWVSVQDGSAQLAAQLLDVQAGTRVLDACAAPGGKTAHLLEHYEIDTLLALDNKSDRIPLLENTLSRLHLKAQVHCADASQPDTWWDGQLFDRILLDVPCSGSGIIRRHPDIKYLRKPKDIVALTIQQARLIEKVWPLLKPGGKLLYVTCSVFAEENYLQIQKFLSQVTDALETVLLADWGHALPIGRQILPGENNLDGFYYACLSKTN